MRGNWLLLAVFFFAGMPALVYQVVWQRALSLYFGVDIYSTSITVATFMLGLGIGALLGGQLADRVRRPILFYAACEAGLGVFGAFSLTGFSLVGESLAGSSLTVVALGNFALLLVPTVLMGMTLPLMCQSLRMSDSSIGRQFSTLYAVNTLGAAFGALLSAYFLIGYLGLTGAALWAAAMNITLAVVCLLAVRSAPAGDLVDEGGSPRGKVETGGVSALPGAGARRTVALVTLCSALSGFVALGYQLAWYRLLTLLLHGTVYVFGTILFVFLCGIAFGSWCARGKSDSGDPLVRFGVAQLGISAYVLAFSVLLGHGSGIPGFRHLLGATALTTFHPAPELLAGDFSLRSIYSLVDIGFWTVAFVGVPTFLMGYGFPQLMRAGTEAVSHLGRSLGRIYLANILGSTAGSLLIGFVLMHYLGTEVTLLILTCLGAFAGVLATVAARRVSMAWRGATAGRLPVLGFAIVLLAVAVFPGKGDLIRAVHYADFEQVEFVFAEDRSGVVALRTQSDIISFSEERQIVGARRLLIDGAAHGEFQSGDQNVALDSAVRLALSAHPSPRRVLSIGLGDGRICASAIADHGVEELVVVELNASLRSIISQTEQGEALFSSEKLRLVIDDGRRWLLANPEERFDVVLMWPLHAAHASSGNLYSREFFELVRMHLGEGGVLLSRSVDMYSTARTIASVFDHVVRIDESTYVAAGHRFAFRAGRAGMGVEEIRGRIQADRGTILREASEAPINRDFRPNSEYYFTYRYADALQTWGRVKKTYRDPEGGTYADLIMP